MIATYEHENKAVKALKALIEPHYKVIDTDMVFIRELYKIVEELRRGVLKDYSIPKEGLNDKE